MVNREPRQKVSNASRDGQVSLEGRLPCLAIQPCEMDEDQGEEAICLSVMLRVLSLLLLTPSPPGLGKRIERVRQAKRSEMGMDGAVAVLGCRARCRRDLSRYFRDLLATGQSSQ